MSSNDPIHEKNGRFKKKVSGNPRGRPRKGFIKVTSLFEQLIPIELDGKVHSVLPEIAALGTLWTEGIGGNKRALRSFYKRFRQFHAPESYTSLPFHTLRVMPMRVGRPDNALELLQIRKRTGDAYIVPDWVVEEGLERDANFDPKGYDLKTIAGVTANPGLTNFKLVCAQLGIALAKPKLAT